MTTEPTARERTRNRLLHLSDARRDELLDAHASEAIAPVLRIVSDWCIEANEVGGVDAGDLAWRLEQAGFPLPDDDGEQQ